MNRLPGSLGVRACYTWQELDMHCEMQNTKPPYTVRTITHCSHFLGVMHVSPLNGFTAYLDDFVSSGNEAYLCF